MGILLYIAASAVFLAFVFVVKELRSLRREINGINNQLTTVNDEFMEDVKNTLAHQKQFSEEVMNAIREMSDSLAETSEKIDETAEADDDNLYNDARSLVVKHQICSTSLLQRVLRVWYARAARLIAA